MSPETIIRGWAFALRDLCDQGALTVSATVEGETEPVTFTYTRGTGCVVRTGERKLEISDEALDAVGYMAADSAPWSSTERPQEAENGI